MERQAVLTGVILSILIFAIASSSLPSYSQERLLRIAYTTGHGEVTMARLPSVGPDLANMVGNLTKKGFTVKEIKDKITPESLADVDFLVLGHVFGAALNYTAAEISAVKAWFNQGKKTIWVSSDSDFGKGDYIIDNANRMLEAVGSKLRFEYAAVEDPVSNAGAPYRVVGNTLNTQDSIVKPLVQGVRKALFHGPTAVVGVAPDGKWVDIRKTKLENVFWVIASSDGAVITNNYRAPSGVDPKVYQSGQTGSYVLIALELYLGQRSSPFFSCCTGKVIASGESPYGSYEPIFKAAYITQKQLEGPTLVLNLIDWGSKVEELPAIIPLEAIAIIAIVVVVAVVAAYRLTRKPRVSAATTTIPPTTQ